LPLTPASPAETLAAALARHGAPRRLALAVSGGGDSVALANLAAARAARGAAEILILHVDHGLRAGSADDARFVAELARTLGAPSQILAREGPAFASAIQARARAARYARLAAAAAQWRADALLVAHTADDQAETALMRRARSDSVRSRAGMAEAGFVAAGAGPAVRLVRPLLDIRRGDLRALAQLNGWSWREDPSNENAAFERVRARRTLAEDPDLADRLIREASDARAAIDACDVASIARFGSAGGAFDALGAARIPAADTDAALVARLIGAVGGGAVDPVNARAAKALDDARRTGRATLGGARLAVRKGRLVIEREPAALLGRAGAPAFAPRQLAPQEEAIFDRRFIVRNGASPASLRPVGGAGPDAAAPSPDPGFASVECVVGERFFRRVRRFDLD
jgi:tRNA(Ile)-lysidine synthase